jgi:predicted transcriptional regulator
VVSIAPVARPNRSDPDRVASRVEFVALRRQLAPSQLEAARELGIGASTIARYESGARRVPNDLIHRMRRLIEERNARRAA